MENINKTQHVEVPHLTESDSNITPKDLLVYASIRRYMNKDTKTAYPALETIAKECGATRPTISKSIKKLEQNNYFEVNKKIGPSGYLQNVYSININKCPHFEMFSFEFLDKTDISFQQKAYLLASQQFMIKENNLGKISFSNKDLGKKINLSEQTISKYNHELAKTPYLTIIKNKKDRNLETGCLTDIKVFDLPALGQALLFTAADHEERISENTNDINLLKEDNLKKDAKIESLEKDIAMLKRAITSNKKSKSIVLD